MRLAAAVVVFLAFTIWSFITIAEPGLTGLVTLLGSDPWARQILVDLTIACTVAWLWLGPDARRHGIASWPYIVATLAVGSIAILGYLVHRELTRLRSPTPRTDSTSLGGGLREAK